MKDAALSVSLSAFARGGPTLTPIVLVASIAVVAGVAALLSCSKRREVDRNGDERAEDELRFTDDDLPFG